MLNSPKVNHMISSFSVNKPNSTDAQSVPKWTQYFIHDMDIIALAVAFNISSPACIKSLIINNYFVERECQVIGMNFLDNIVI